MSMGMLQKNMGTVCYVCQQGGAVSCLCGKLTVDVASEAWKLLEEDARSMPLTGLAERLVAEDPALSCLASPPQHTRMLLC